MSKAQELADFAKANGLQIHGRTSPDEWAELLEQNEGRCPCNHADSCPCDEAISKVKNANADPADQSCGCTFYVSDAYLKHYKRMPWKPDTQNQSQQRSQDSQSSPTVPKITTTRIREVREVDPGMKDAFLKTAQTYMDGLDLIRDGKLADFTEKIRLEEAINPCDLCKQDADVVSSHADYVRALCATDQPECRTEMQRLIDRTIKVIDEDLMSAGMEREKESTGNKEGTKKNAWIEFSRQIMSSPELEGMPQKNKMKIAAALYRGEYETIEEALAALS